MVRLAGREEPLPFYELEAVVLNEPPAAAPPAVAPGAKPPDAGPGLYFREGGFLPAEVREAAADAVSIALGAGNPAAGGPAALEVPAEVVQSIRLRETHPSDDLFEVERKKAPGDKDAVYVRRGSSLLRVDGVFRGLDREFLHLEYEGKVRRLARPIVYGIVLAPVAAAASLGDYPALFELAAGGSFPACLAGVRAAGGGRRQVLVRFPGSRSAEPQALAAEHVVRIRFASDRVLFLSAATPATAAETPLIGARSAFPWQRDRAAAGGGLKLGGKSFRRGLGVHSRTALEYDLGGRYRSFAAVIGLDDAAGAAAGVTFRVAADGKEIYTRDMARRDSPETLLLPVTGVKRLKLEVDYGPDGLDLGDHADWADARVIQ